MDKRMTSDEYASTQQPLIMLANLVLTYNLDGFLQAIGLADAIGPIVDPTLWMRGSRNMRFIEDLARAAQRFQSDIRQAYERHGIPLPMPTEKEASGHV